MPCQLLTDSRQTHAAPLRKNLRRSTWLGAALLALAACSSSTDVESDSNGADTASAGAAATPPPAAASASKPAAKDRIDRKAKEQHFLRIIQLVKDQGLHHLKVYMMVGLPDENDADIDELIGFAKELGSIHPLAIGVSPFVAKRNTPLDGAEFAGITTVEARLARLRRGLQGQVELRATSARWAYVEYVLAQGSWAEGRAVLRAVHAGGRFSDYKAAFKALPDSRKRRALRVVA